MTQSLTPLTILSCNIHKGFAFGNRGFTLHRLRDALRSANPDVVFLQEVVGEHRHHASQRDDWPALGQAEHLADVHWPHVAYGANAQHHHGHHGNALLSKHPLLGWTNHDVSNHRLERRGLLHGVISHDGRRIHLICCHLDLTRWGRDRQLARLVVLINSLPIKEPLIVAGDFNDWRGLVGNELTSLGMMEVHRDLHGHHAKTFPAWWPKLTLDRMYLRGLIPIEAKALDTGSWRTLSDHVPLWCAATLIA